MRGRKLAVIDAEFEIIGSPVPSLEIVQELPPRRRKYRWVKIVWQLWCAGWITFLAGMMLYSALTPAKPFDPCLIPVLPMAPAHPGDPPASVVVSGCHVSGGDHRRSEGRPTG